MNSRNLDLTCFGKNFALSIGLIPIIIILASLQPFITLFRGMDIIAVQNAVHSSVLLDALHTPFVLACIPVLSALPGAASFMDEYSTGFYRFVLHRIQGGYLTYCRRKVVSVALSGGLSLFIGIIFSYVILMVVFIPFEKKADMNTITENQTDMVSQDIHLSGLNSGLSDESFSIRQWLQEERISEIVTQSLLFFITGMFWALTGALLSLVLSSRYIAYFSPFLIFYFLTILSERYFTKAYVLNPKNWVLLTTDWPRGEIGFSLIPALSLVVLSVAYFRTIRRKFKSA